MKHYLKNALDRVYEPILILSSNGECLYYNHSLASYLGLPSAASTSQLIHTAWPALSSIELRAGEQIVDFDRPGQEPHRLTLQLEVLGDKEWLVRLITEANLRRGAIDFHSERLQTLGMLAGGVAHDFNNILAGILGHTTYLRTILAAEGNHRDSLRAVEDGAKKASIIIQQILNFSRLDSVEKIVACDLGSITQRTCTLLRGAIPPDFELVVNLPDAPVRVLGVEAKIAQVIVNLVVNARDAMTNTGRISVTIREGSVISSRDSRSAARMGIIEVQDNGQGMSAETLERAFEPYFSTKKDKGTGLGLATVHAIVDLFGGSIDVSSKLQRGTTFTISLPLATGTREVAEERSDESRPVESSGAEKILIVDDESPVRNVLSLSLQHLGYEIALASSGIEAIEIFKKAQGDFSLVILDMLMPNLSGEEVFFKLKEIDDQVKALIISGYSSEEAVQNIIDHGGKGFIQKPFTIGELSRKVRRCLDGEL